MTVAARSPIEDVPRVLAQGVLDDDARAVLVHDLDRLEARIAELQAAFPADALHAVAIKAAKRDEVSTSLAAKGAGKLAEKIIALAKEHGIPVKEDPDLVAILAKLDVASREEAATAGRDLGLIAHSGGPAPSPDQDLVP